VDLDRDLVAGTIGLIAVYDMEVIAFVLWDRTPRVPFAANFRLSALITALLIWALTSRYDTRAH
jgi:hypothetical protein